MPSQGLYQWQVSLSPRKASVRRIKALPIGVHVLHLFGTGQEKRFLPGVKGKVNALPAGGVKLPDAVAAVGVPEGAGKRALVRVLAHLCVSNPLLTLVQPFLKSKCPAPQCGQGICRMSNEMRSYLSCCQSYRRLPCCYRRASWSAWPAKRSGAFLPADGPPRRGSSSRHL